MCKIISELGLKKDLPKALAVRVHACCVLVHACS